MKNFLTKNKIWLLGVGYVLIGIAFVWYFFLPSIDKIRGQANKIEEKILDKKILENRLSQLTDMRNQSEEFSRNKENLGKTIGQSEEVIFIQYLEDLAKETNNQINIEIADDQEKDSQNKKLAKTIENGGEIIDKLNYDKFLIMDLTLLGNFQEAFDFIQQIETSNYYSNIIAIDMEKIEKEEKFNRAQSMFSFSEEASEVNKKYLKTELKLIVYKNGFQN